MKELIIFECIIFSLNLAISSVRLSFKLGVIHPVCLPSVETTDSIHPVFSGLIRHNLIPSIPSLHPTPPQSYRRGGGGGCIVNANISLITFLSLFF